MSHHTDVQDVKCWGCYYLIRSTRTDFNAQTTCLHDCSQRTPLFFCLCAWHLVWLAEWPWELYHGTSVTACVCKCLATSRPLNFAHSVKLKICGQRHVYVVGTCCADVLERSINTRGEQGWKSFQARNYFQIRKCLGEFPACVCSKLGTPAPLKPRCSVDMSSTCPHLSHRRHGTRALKDMVHERTVALIHAVAHDQSQGIHKFDCSIG